MFLEPQFRGQRSGWIEVVCGSMFSGKTEELLRRIRRARLAHLKVAIFKPAADTRYDEVQVVSHDQNAVASIVIQHSSEILSYCDDYAVIAIDEAQFFDKDLPRICERVVMKGIRVIIAGLDMDFMGRPFGPMPDLLAIAEYITKLHAICPHCGSLATHSYRLSTEEDTVVLGEKNNYEPRCRVCYQMGNIIDFTTPQ